MLITGGSESRKINTLVTLIGQQDKINQKT